MLTQKVMQVDIKQGS